MEQHSGTAMSNHGYSLKWTAELPVRLGKRSHHIGAVLQTGCAREIPNLEPLPPATFERAILGGQREIVWNSHEHEHPMKK